MRKVKFKTADDIPGHKAGDIFDVYLIFEGSMGDGLILWLGDGGVSCIEIASKHSEGYWVHDELGFINFDGDKGKLDSFIAALSILA